MPPSKDEGGLSPLLHCALFSLRNERKEAPFLNCCIINFNCGRGIKTRSDKAHFLFEFLKVELENPDFFNISSVIGYW